VADLPGFVGPETLELVHHDLRTQHLHAHEATCLIDVRHSKDGSCFCDATAASIALRGPLTWSRSSRRSHAACRTSCLLSPKRSTCKHQSLLMSHCCWSTAQVLINKHLLPLLTTGGSRP
jgi:hypothetical protein